jgi:hypothetical protein
MVFGGETVAGPHNYRSGQPLPEYPVKMLRADYDVRLPRHQLIRIATDDTGKFPAQQVKNRFEDGAVKFAKSKKTDAHIRQSLPQNVSVPVSAKNDGSY